MVGKKVKISYFRKRNRVNDDLCPSGSSGMERVIESAPSLHVMQKRVFVQFLFCKIQGWKFASRI